MKSYEKLDFFSESLVQTTTNALGKKLLCTMSNSKCLASPWLKIVQVGYSEKDKAGPRDPKSLFTECSEDIVQTWARFSDRSDRRCLEIPSGNLT